MEQKLCDVCGNVIVKESKVGLKITTKNDIVHGHFDDICSQCSDKLYRLVMEIKDRPRASCKECGHVA